MCHDLASFRFVAFPLALLLALAATTPARGRVQAAPEFLYVAVGEGLRADLGKVPPDSGPMPVLYLSTKKEYPCLLRFDVRVQRSADEILVLVNDHPGGTGCASTRGPARGYAYLGLEAGTYRVRVSRLGHSDRFQIHVSDSVLSLQPLESRFTEVTGSVKRRKPTLSMAMYCRVPRLEDRVESSQTQVCDAFAQQLLDSLKANELHLVPTADGPYRPGWANEWRSPRIFRYEHASDFRRAYYLLQQFSRATLASQAPGVSIALGNWRGAGFDSRVCATCAESATWPPW